MTCDLAHNARAFHSGCSALVAVLSLLAGCSSPAPAQREAESDAGKKEWMESEVALPPYPKPEGLLPFSGGSPSGHQFFVDAPSLSIGADGVVRYTLVVKTQGGATNVSYEGVRCEERHQKTYATGLPSGSWARARDPQWRRIEYRTVNNHHGVLYSEFLCEGKYTAPSVKEIVQLFRQPRPRPRADE
jgi:hypothetical protein